MNTDTVARWAWPRGRLHLRSIDWREQLHIALHLRLGREPTLSDLVYNSDADGHRTTVTITVDDTDYEFRGAVQDSTGAAIRCVAWVALMQLCNAGILETPLPFT